MYYTTDDETDEHEPFWARVAQDEEAFWAALAQNEEKFWNASDEAFESLLLADHARWKKEYAEWKEAHLV